MSGSGWDISCVVVLFMDIQPYEPIHLVKLGCLVNEQAKRDVVTSFVLLYRPSLVHARDCTSDRWMSPVFLKAFL